MQRSTRLIVLTLLLGACGSPKKSESPFAPPPDPKAGPPAGDLRVKPWTDRFYVAGALVARDVRIEGPDGLLEHVVARQDNDLVVVRTETTPGGFLQVITLRPEAQGEEIRAQLDNLAICALHSVTILERPFGGDVVVEGVGDAFHSEKGGEERRGPSIRIVGPIAR